MDNASQVKLLNMCMIYDEKKDMVITQHRVKKTWPGFTFPGGKVEHNESLVQSTIREVKEETGLDINNLSLCGIVHWYNIKNHDRWMVFLYKTKSFKGQLLINPIEGDISWVSLDELKKLPLSIGMSDYLSLFLKEEFSELYNTWDEEICNEFQLF
ncbi:MAG: 8-oxo-dGTP diphosphatase [Clostridiales bacterium]|nr:8-oxo-dGTP diphosphatase [Clostridiales bacterium]